MADYMPLYHPGAMVTYHATAAVTAGQLVKISGTAPATGLPPVIPCATAADRPVGVAARDAASGEEVAVWSGGVQELLAAGAVTQGATVTCAAAGSVAASTGTDVIIGVAELAIADTVRGRVRLFL